MAGSNLSISDAIRTVEHSRHTLSGASVQASLFEVGEDGGCTYENDIIIIVSGMFPSTSEDAILNYFENSRRSGGGIVSNFHYTGDGEAILSVSEV